MGLDTECDLVIEACGDARIRNVITSYSIHYTKLYDVNRNSAMAVSASTASACWSGSGGMSGPGGGVAASITDLV